MTLETLKQCRSASLAHTAVKQRIAELRKDHRRCRRKVHVHGFCQSETAAHYRRQDYRHR